MIKEELKNKYTERAKIFQQAMESCHSSSPMDCIEWFADRISELEKENAELKADNDARKFAMTMSEKVEKQLREENAELRKVAEFQQSTSMSRHFEIKKLKEVLTVGTTWNKGLNSRNKYLEEEMDKYRNMVFDKDDQLTEAKEIIRKLLEWEDRSDYGEHLYQSDPALLGKAEAFINKE